MDIRRLEAGDREGAISLVLSILTDEFAFPVTRADLADMEEAESFYSGDSALWVAAVGDRIIGTIALKTFDSGGALRRMFVAPDWRGADLAIGAKLLRTLTDHALECGLTDIYLGTTQAFGGAHRFYKKNGFVIIGKTALPYAFPAMPPDDTFYHLRL